VIWADQTWVDLTAVPEESVVVLPLASCEQHGLHLPVLTDTYIITHIAKKLEAAMPSKVWLMPTLWVGASHHHRAFPGTISLPETLYMQVVREMVECVLDSAVCHEGHNTRVLLLNGHGGNITPMQVMLNELAWARRDKPLAWVMQSTYWLMNADKFAALEGFETDRVTHACEFETSMMLSAKHDLVRMDRAKTQVSSFDNEYLVPSAARSSRVDASTAFHRRSNTGGLGKPEAATAEKGERIIDLVVDEVSEFIKTWLTWQTMPDLGPNDMGTGPGRG